MSKYSTDVVYKVTQEKKGEKLEMGHLYFKNVPVNYASVHKPRKAWQSEDLEYTTTLFINADTMSKLEKIGINKELAEVGVTKIKKGTNRGEFKFKVEDHEDYKGMFGAQFNRKTVKRNPKDNSIVKTYEPLKVVDSEGNTFTDDIGNGSVCTIKMFAYRNTEDMLVVMMDTVMVIDHIPYIGKSGDGFDEEMGITIKSVVVKEKEDAKKLVEEFDVNNPDYSDDIGQDIPF